MSIAHQKTTESLKLLIGLWFIVLTIPLTYLIFLFVVTLPPGDDLSIYFIVFIALLGALLVLPVFFLITLVNKKEREYAKSLFIFAEIGYVFSIAEPPGWGLDENLQWYRLDDPV